MTGLVVARGTSLTPQAPPHGAARPAWLDTLLASARAEHPLWGGRFEPPSGSLRESAVLVLFGPGPAGDDSLLLIERSHDMRSHAGQVAFPGGKLDPGDHDAVAAALRESAEEVRLDPAGVDVLDALPTRYVPVSDFAVTPVLAWWRQPSPVQVGEPDEVAQVLSVPVRFLADPANRHTVVHNSGWIGPAWELGEDLLLWGFTGGVVDRLLQLAGLAQDWDRSIRRPLPERFLRRRS